MSVTSKELTLNNFRKIPVLGIGTWQSDKGQVCEAIKHAIDVGYRHIDCAFIYGNESEVGEAIQDKISSNVVERKDLFVTSKVWNSHHSKALTRKHLKESLQLLKLDYLDLYLIHSPMGFKEGGDLVPKDENGKFMYSDVDYLETWEEMENCVKDGLVKSIGLSNFGRKQIDRILSNCSIKPSVLQMECHAYFNQTRLIEYCKENNIVMTSYSPFGSPATPWVSEGNANMLEDPTIKKIAEKYGKTVAQVLIRFQIDRDVSVIPKSVTKSRIEENADVFDFKLSDEDLKTIASLDKNVRLFDLKWFDDHPHYPFKDEY